MAIAVSKLEDHLGYWLRFVSNHVSHAFTEKIEASGVTVAERVLMREMHQQGPANPSQLARTLGMTRGTVSKLVERLCQKELAARSASVDDRRYQSVCLTATGTKLVPTLATLADQNDLEFFGDLTSDQRAKFVTLLQDIVRKHGWKEVPIS